MLRLNAPASTVPGAQQPSDAEVYKVLVLDHQTKDIIAPLLRVSDLRRHGVTLHLMLEAERHTISDVPAVYFISATEEHINRIVQVGTVLVTAKVMRVPCGAVSLSWSPDFSVLSKVLLRARFDAVTLRQDAVAGLYDSFHLNFVTYIPKPLMEQLAAGAALATL